MSSQNHTPTYKKNAKHKVRKRAEEKVADRNARTLVHGIAADLAAKLTALGFTVHRHDAFTTCSSYLAVDYGLCNSIRISDHPGKPHLNYRYNVLLGLDAQHTVKVGDVERFFYPPDHVDSIVVDICARLGQRIMQFGGTAGYLAAKENTRGLREGAAGFWNYAKEVEAEDGND